MNPEQPSSEERISSKAFPRELAKAEPQSEVLQRELLEAYSKYDVFGPKIGEVSKINELTGKTVTLEVRSQIVEYWADIVPLSYERIMLTTEGKEIGDMFLRVDEPEGYSYKVINKYASDRTPELYYGNGNERLRNPKKVFIEKVATKGMNWEDQYQFRGLGRAMVEIAIERSLQLGAEGRVQGQAAGDSWLFWKKLGFMAQDIFNEEGNLIRSSIDFEKNMQEPDKKYMSEHLGEKTRAYFFLPDDVREYEKRKVAKIRHLDANAETIEFLFKKHEFFSAQDTARLEAERAIGSNRNPIYIASLLLKAGQEERARSFLILVEKQLLETPDRTLKNGAAEIYDALGDSARAEELYRDLAKEWEEYARQAKESKDRIDWLRGALPFYVRAGDKVAVDRLTKELGEDAIGDI